MEAKEAKPKLTSQDGEQKILILLTSHWAKKWFTELILPASRYKDFPANQFLFMDTADREFQENFDELRETILAYEENLVVFAVTDVTMRLYSSVLESLKQEGKYTPGGANFHCFLLATNKLANRKLITRSSQVKSMKVTSDMEYLPDLGVKGFFKPLEGVASEGVKVVPLGEQTKNPLYQTKVNQSEPSILTKLSEGIKELQPFVDASIVGLVEEYIPPHSRVSTVSIDGYIFNGEINHYVISDNVYQEDNPEVFDSLVTPTQRLSKEQQGKCWQLYDDVVKEFVARGLNNQFIDVEAFFLKNGRLEVMEVNCRTYSNMMPGFARVYGENCMISAALDLLRGIDPKYSNVLESNEGRICVASYVPYLEGAPSVVEFRDCDGTIWGAYYAPPDKTVAHIYSLGRGLESDIRRSCDVVYRKVTALVQHPSKAEGQVTNQEF